MSHERPEQPTEDPEARLERAFIAEFLQRRGHTLSTLKELPEEQANALMREASLYASGKRTEVESRAHYVEEIRQADEPSHGRGRGHS